MAGPGTHVAPHWEHFSHEADIGLRGTGRTLAEAFEQAALALTAVIVDPTDVAARERVEIRREAPGDELLLVEWLNACDEPWRAKRGREARGRRVSEGRTQRVRSEHRGVEPVW